MSNKPSKQLTADQILLCERFISAYSNVKKHLIKNLHEQKEKPLAFLVLKFYMLNPTWHDKEFLLNICNLKQELTYEGEKPYEFYSVPAQWVVEKLEEIEIRLKALGLILTDFARKMSKVKEDKNSDSDFKVKLKEDDSNAAIFVFIDERSHILIQASNYPYMNMINDKYFDIHLCDTVIKSKYLDQRRLKKIVGMSRLVAIELFRHWMEWGNKNYVINNAYSYFPTTRIKNPYAIYFEATKLIRNDGILKQIKNQIENKKTPLPTIIGNSDNDKQNLKVYQKKEIREDIIKGIISHRKIISLFHFTHLKNLGSICKSGLKNRIEINNLPGHHRLIINDLMRWDKHLNAVCLSISFPNYRMFYKYNNGNRKDWVVISLSPEILWKYECAFYESNAASKDSRNIPFEKRMKVTALRGMFSDLEYRNREDLNIPDHYTTDPQAEVLVFNPIPVSEFQKVHFSDCHVMNHFLSKFSSVDNNLFELNQEYFKPRIDYKFWQKK